MNVSSPTVLVVDDDREVQAYLTERLEREGWRVIVERDGDWALRSFQRRRFDAVILDILVPVVSGYQVAEQLRAMPEGKEVGILMLTGVYRGARHRQEAIARYDLLDYLDKPVEGERVVELLREFFAKRVAEAAEAAPGPVAPPESASEATSPAPPTQAEAPPAQVDERQREEQREVDQLAARVQTPSGRHLRPITIPPGGWPAHVERPFDLSLRGNLRRVSFPVLLSQLYRRGVTGGLFLLRDKIKKIVYLRCGHPAFIKSNVLEECLGRIFVRERMITERQCEESVRRMKVEKRQQGSILIEMGAISPHNLRFGLERQLQVKLFDVFQWLEGEFVFRDDVPLPSDVIELDLSNAQIVLEGIRRHFDKARLREILSPFLDQHPILTPDPALRYQHLPLSTAEQELVVSLDGSRPVRELVNDRRQPPSELAAMALLYGLHCIGVVAMSDRPMDSREARGNNGQDALAERAPTRISRFGDSELAAFLAERQGAPPHAVLGLPAVATSEEVDRAFSSLAFELHPDRFRGRPQATALLARRAFDLVNRAHGELASPSSTRVEPTSLADTAPIEIDSAHRTLLADEHFRAGQRHLEARSFALAEVEFREAVAMRPDVGLYHAYLGWSAFCARERGIQAADEALPILERAVELSPSIDEPHYFLGMVFRSMARFDLAEAELEKALACNPNSQAALDELTAVHRERQR
ncbi:MAG: response regulator [Deltaproteobacteria bacterium]|nr:response regulator [Deltaproteobacteria bacterium]